MNTTEIRKKADELEQKLQSLIDDFQKEVNPHGVSVSISAKYFCSEKAEGFRHFVESEVKI